MRRLHGHVLSAAVVLLAVLLVPCAMVLAGPAVAGPDPFADAVDPSSSITVLSAGDAVGAPDGLPATVVTAVNTALVLDLGAARREPAT